MNFGVFSVFGRFVLEITQQIPFFFSFCLVQFLLGGHFRCEFRIVVDPMLNSFLLLKIECFVLISLLHVVREITDL